MMIPFSAVVMWTFGEKIGNGWKKILCNSGKIAFIFSISIEMLQLLLRLGTFQYTVNHEYQHIFWPPFPAADLHICCFCFAPADFRQLFRPWKQFFHKTAIRIFLMVLHHSQNVFQIAEEIFLPGYDVEVSDLSIYGYGTKTVVIRAMWENWLEDPAFSSNQSFRLKWK